jgi:glycine/D-amino acid oxidase-like deaminating enzyme
MMGETRETVDADAGKLAGEGVKAEAVGPEDVVEMFPSLSTCAVPFDLTGEIEHECAPGEAFLYESLGGYVEPVGANQDLIEASRRGGASVEFNSRVTGVTRANGRVTGVELSDGTEISAGLVINAAGPWCNQLNAMAGADLRWTLTPTRIQTVYRSWPADLGPIPVGADATTGIYFRPETAG